MGKKIIECTVVYKESNVLKIFCFCLGSRRRIIYEGYNLIDIRPWINQIDKGRSNNRGKGIDKPINCIFNFPSCYLIEFKRFIG